MMTRGQSCTDLGAGEVSQVEETANTLEWERTGTEAGKPVRLEEGEQGGGH